ncbi:MAG: ribose 5-phosphate isomerase B [Candidatus Peribacteraceae bacterium]|nr:ribose 5-phosphate isomerase B [Candidatus Peribacteraceae bacterium]
MPSTPRVVLGTDHAGYELKEAIKKHLISKKIDVIDVGTFSEESCDYPPIMQQACAAVLEHKCLGIIFGGSGNGEAMVANKVAGIRCARCVSVWDAEMGRKHNNAQVMALGGRVTEPELACTMVDTFLETAYEGGRHQKRLEQFPDYDPAADPIA